MESIGEIIKKRRSERGLSLADAHEATKITMQNLAALEEDRFDAFPNRVYARAFLRDYANFLGLDSNDLQQRYETEWGSPAAVVTKRKPRSFAAIIVFILLLGLGGAGAYYYATEILPGNESTKLQITPEPEKPKPSPKPKPEKPEPTTPVTGLNAEGQPETTPTTGTPGQSGQSAASTDTDATTTTNTPAKPAVPQQVKVHLRATGDAWVKVMVDGKVELERILVAGDEFTTAGKKVWVRVGSAGNIQVKVNDKSYGVFGPPGKKLNREWTVPSAPPQGTSATTR